MKVILLQDVKKERAKGTDAGDLRRLRPELYAAPEDRHGGDPDAINTMRMNDKANQERIAGKRPRPWRPPESCGR